MADPTTINLLNECTDPVAGDQLLIYDVSAADGDDERRVNVNKFAVVAEGTFTTSIVCGASGTITLDAAWDTLSYYKVGKLVIVQGVITISAVSSPTGAAMLSNMPFAIANAITEGVEFFAGTVIHSGSAQKLLAIRYAPTNDRPHIRYWTGTAWADAASQLAAGDSLFISFQYLAAS